MATGRSFTEEQLAQLTEEEREGMLDPNLVDDPVIPALSAVAWARLTREMLASAVEGPVVLEPETGALVALDAETRTTLESVAAKLAPDVDFTMSPESIGVQRARRARSARAWSPRDALVDLLRDIDAGTIKPKAMVVSMSAEDGEGDTVHVYRNASPDIYSALGLAARLTYRLQEP